MIEVIARVLVMKENKILLCKSIEQGHYFLPGGHVEEGESAEKALEREMKEETETNLTNFVFAGLFENAFQQDGKTHHEINILFTADAVDENIVSKETHITFERVIINDLPQIKFLPKIFAEKIVQWNMERGIIYLSTLSP